MKHLLCAAAIAALAAAAIAGGAFITIPPPSPTGGVARVSVGVSGELAHVDYSLDKAGRLSLVSSIAGADTASTTLTNAPAAAAARWTPGAGVALGGTDYIELSTATNATATLYLLTK